MRRIEILQEIGITSWISRDALQLAKSKANEEPMIQAPSSPKNPQKPQSSQPKTSDQTTIIGPKDQPLWTLVWQEKNSSKVLFSKICRAIENLGVGLQVLTMSTSTVIKAQDIQGDLLIAFGESATLYFSGEHAPVDELREILFEAVNSRSVEIPVIVTHDPEACLSQAHFKKEVWQDILMARTTYLETQ
jgi:hypothetical protein